MLTWKHLLLRIGLYGFVIAVFCGLGGLLAMFLPYLFEADWETRRAWQRDTPEHFYGRFPFGAVPGGIIALLAMRKAERAIREHFADLERRTGGH